LITLEEAVNRAKVFLEKSAGIHGLALESVSYKDEKARWVICFRSVYSALYPYLYTVELERETGEVLTYRKEKRE
jgi:hypothetical protein